MKYKSFKGEIQLSRLGMGNMRLPVLEGKQADIDYPKAKTIIDACISGGVNYYDTAYIYHEGNSEVFLGEALKDYPRDSYYVADKFNIVADPDYRRQFAHQLQRLQMDRIDFYLIHDVHVEPILQSGCIEYFDAMKKEGKIRYFGFSFHGTAEGLRKMLKAYPFDFVQIQLNYYDWYFGNAKELYHILAEAGVPVMVMEPVHGGLLAKLPEKAQAALDKMQGGRSTASNALRFVMSLPNVQVILSGMSEISQAEDNIKTFDEALPLTDEHREDIKKAAEILHSELAVACTACRYCCPDCPMGLDIPALIKAYNGAKLGGIWRMPDLLPEDKEKWPSACIGCASCQRHCPQEFPIPQIMDEMKEMLCKLEKEE